MHKSRLFLSLAIFSAAVLAFAVIFSHRFIWTARLIALPSIMACLVFLALYAKSTRME